MEKIVDLNISNLKVIQNTDYFMFGIDSVILANFVKTHPKDIVLDLCTGSAVIPIILTAKQRFENIIGVELQSEMFNLAQRNVKLNNLENKICLLNEDINNIKNIRKYIIDNFGMDSVDVICCNPPYKQKGTGLDISCSVKEIAKLEIKCTLENVMQTSSSLLRSRGRLYLVHKPERLADCIVLARKYNLELKSIKFMQPDISKASSLVLYEFVKDGGNESKVLPVLLQYEPDVAENGENIIKYSKEIMDMYNEQKE